MSDILAGQVACAQVVRSRDTLYGSEGWGSSTSERAPERAEYAHEFPGQT